MNKNAISFLLIISLSCVLSSGPAVEEIFNQFVELKTALGAQKEDIGVTIAQIKHAVISTGKQFKTLARDLKTQCRSANAKFSAAITSIDRSTREAEVSISNWKNTLVTSTADRKKASAAIKTARNEYEQFEKRLAKLVIDYQVVAEDGDKKLNVIKTLRDIITDELISHQQTSFVQLSKFQKKLGELKEMLVTNTDSIYGPVVGALLDLATERGFSDQGVLRKILYNLKALSKSIRGFRVKQEAALDAEVDNLKKQLRITVQRIDDYQKMRAQSVSKGLDARHYIRFHTTEIAHLKVERNRKGSEQALFNKICAFEKKEIRSDIALLKGINAIYHGINRKILRLN